MELDVSPRPIPLVDPVAFTARFEGGRASQVKLTATGETMDMGVTTVALAAEPSTDGARFGGTGSLPVCVTERLGWRGRVDFELDGAPRVAAVRFTTHRPTKPPAASGEVERVDGPTADFLLHSSKGPVRLSDFRGKVVLLYFGYTFCPDICPTSLTATARALRRLPPEQLAEVETLFVSVDPERDTPEHLAEYAAFFHPSIHGVTGTDAEVAAAARPFGVVYARHEATGAGGYVVDHSALTYLVAPDGHLAAKLPHAAPPQLVVAELTKWLPSARPPINPQ